MFTPELLAALRKSQNRFLMTNLMACVIFILAGLGMIIGAFFSEAGINATLLWAGLGVLVVGILSTLYYYWKHVDIAKILANEPQQIVWVYRLTKTGKASGVTVAQFQFLMFGLQNKRLVQVRMTPSLVDTLLQQIPHSLGHASLGYTPELEKTFRENPLALLQS